MIKKINNLAKIASFTFFASSVFYENTGGDPVHATGSGTTTTAEANDGIRFMFASGNVASGIFKLYGMRD